MRSAGRRLRSGGPLVSLPSSCALTPPPRRYDVVMLTMLIYVAIVAPFQVAFATDPKLNVIFLIDRFVDVFFVFDLVLNFVRPIAPGMPARNLTLIRKHYTKSVVAYPLPSRFGWDVISTIPWDLLSPMIERELSGEFGQLKVSCQPKANI